METTLAIAQELRRHRVISVVGPPGSGKSWAVQHLPPELLRRYRGGGRRVDLHRAAGLRALFVQLSAALELPPPPLNMDMAMHFFEAALEARAPTLLVFDGADDVSRLWPEAVERLVRAARSCSFVFTGRRPMDLPGERVLTIGGDDEVTRIERSPAASRREAA
jgi:hypothetical protein